MEGGAHRQTGRQRSSRCPRARSSVIETTKCGRRFQFFERLESGSCLPFGVHYTINYFAADVFLLRKILWVCNHSLGTQTRGFTPPPPPSLTSHTPLYAFSPFISSLS